jgi:hypothetical protein
MTQVTSAHGVWGGLWGAYFMSRCMWGPGVDSGGEMLFKQQLLALMLPPLPAVVIHQHDFTTTPHVLCTGRWPSAPRTRTRSLPWCCPALASAT